MSLLSEIVGLGRDLIGLLTRNKPKPGPRTRVKVAPLPPSPGQYSVQPDEEDTQPFGRPKCRHTVKVGRRCAQCGETI